MMTNLFYHENLTQLHFYSIGIPYFVFLMFCLTSYRAQRELCFYCVYALIQNAISMSLMIGVYLEHVPWLYFWLCGSILLFAIVLRGFQNQEQKRKREKMETDARKMQQTLFDKMS
eukprot:403356347